MICVFCYRHYRFLTNFAFFTSLFFIRLFNQSKLLLNIYVIKELGPWQRGGGWSVEGFDTCTNKNGRLLIIFMWLGLGGGGMFSVVVF